MCACVMCVCAFACVRVCLCVFTLLRLKPRVLGMSSYCLLLNYIPTTFLSLKHSVILEMSAYPVNPMASQWVQAGSFRPKPPQWSRKTYILGIIFQGMLWGVLFEIFMGPFQGLRAASRACAGTVANCNELSFLTKAPTGSFTLPPPNSLCIY